MVCVKLPIVFNKNIGILKKSVFFNLKFLTIYIILLNGKNGIVI